MRRTTQEARTFPLWSLSEEVTIEQGADDGALLLTSRWGQDRIDRPSPAVREVLRRMELGPVLLDNALEGYEDQCLLALSTLGELSHLVVRTLGMDDLKGPLLSVVPESSAVAPFVLMRPPGERRIRLPRHVSFSVPEPGAGCVLQSACSSYQVVLHRPEAAWVATALAWPTTLTAVAAALPLPPRVTGDVIGYLGAAGLVAAA